MRLLRDALVVVAGVALLVVVACTYVASIDPGPNDVVNALAGWTFVWGVIAGFAAGAITDLWM